MSALPLKKRYNFRLLLNEGRAFQHLVKTGRGETQIWEWIHEMVGGNSSSMPLPLVQKLLKSSLDRDIGPALMLASAGSEFPIVVRLPASWRAFLKGRGSRLHFLSAILWQTEILRKFREGLLAYRRLSMPSLQSPSTPYAVLNNLHDNTYGSVFQNQNAQDFLKWFHSKFFYKNYWIVPVSPQKKWTVDNFTIVPSPFPALAASELVQFKSLAKRALITAFLRLMVGKWADSYMLADRLEEIYITCVPANRLASIYVFNNASYIYRPLWTYEAERRGAEIALFFYATNNFDIEMTSRSSNGVAPGYPFMTWPHIYTQHENHKKHLESFISAKVYVAGLIPYEDSGAEVNLPGDIRIAYLDVQPFRRAFMASIGRPCHFYTEDISRESLEDLVSVSRDLGARLFIKPKRNVGKRLSLSYRKTLTEIQDQDHVELVDYHISPQRVCEKADIVICQPFTTAALFAREAGKPVAYYDAQGLFLKDQLACQGIPLLSGRAELENWLNSARKAVIREREIA